MSRFISSSLEAQSLLSDVSFRQLVDIICDSATLYCITGNQYAFTRGNTYSPIGGLGGIDPIQEEADPFPRSVRMWLSSVNSNLVATALAEDLFNKQVIVYNGFIDPVKGTMPNTPEVFFKGRVSEYSYLPMDKSRGPCYEINVESALMARMNPAYMTRESYWTTMGRSGDTLFNYVPLIIGSSAKWGDSNTVLNGTFLPANWGQYPRGTTGAGAR